jgi:L-cysteine:1D-myo-inositol 2-amino-2-deoxy-alpha-D-glucopyranoside ligase
MSSRLHLFDHLSGRVQEFEPVNDPVTLYVCGITPYDATHLGHAFTFVAFDVLVRYLKNLGHAVRYVQNVTDIDDPLFDKARELGVSHWDLAASEIRQFRADMRSLNALPPDVFPRASEEIPGMVELVERLVATGHAYQSNGSVYFGVDTDPEYGKLSHYDRETMIELARERGGTPDNPLQHNPFDFVLWRPAKPGEPEAASPWGQGLPGWHLECSTMALKYLGAPLDIHGGGSDLIFPHHENEIAQSEAATGIEPFARFWMHTGMVYLGGEKMSKSLGNMVFVRNLAPQYGADAVRLYISGHHYRDRLEYEAAGLREAGRVAARLAAAASAVPQQDSPAPEITMYRERFLERMNDDLDTPGAIGVLGQLSEHIEQAEGDLGGAPFLLRELGGILGLRLDQSAAPVG